MTTHSEFDLYQLATREAEPVQTEQSIDPVEELRRLIAQIADPHLAQKIRQQLKSVVPELA